MKQEESSNADAPIAQQGHPRFGEQPSSSSKKNSAISECVVQDPLETLSKKGLRTFLLTWLLF
jgi:hypothetical protein